MQQFSDHGGYLAQSFMNRKSLIEYTPSAVALLHFGSTSKILNDIL